MANSWNTSIDAERYASFNIPPGPESFPIQVEHDERMIKALAKGALRTMHPSTGRSSSALRYFAPSLGNSLDSEKAPGGRTTHMGKWITMQEAQGMTGLEPATGNVVEFRLPDQPKEAARVAEVA